MKAPKLKLWPVVGINMYNLPEQLRRMFPETSANEEDCIPVHEQESVIRQEHGIKPCCTESTDPNVVSLF